MKTKHFIKFIERNIMQSKLLVLKMVWVGGMACLLSACLSGPKSFEIRGDGDPILNRDISGKSLSVVVRVYQLKDAGEFSKLTFDMLASGRPETEFLGQELLGKSEAIVVPGGKYVNTDKISSDAKYVGVVALFRRPDQHYWRYLLDADSVRSNGVVFKVKDCYLTLNDVKPLVIPGQPNIANVKPECGTASMLPQRQSAQSTSQPAQPAGPARKRQLPKVNTPDVNVGVPNAVAPANVQVGSGGVNAINVGGSQTAPGFAQ